MAARKRMPTNVTSNGRKQDRDRVRERPIGGDGPYWRNSTTDTERGQVPVNRKLFNGFSQGSVTFPSRSQKSLQMNPRSRVRIEGRVAPSVRNSTEMTRKFSASPQMFVEVAAVAQTPRKTGVSSDTSKAKKTASSRSISSKKQQSNVPKKAKIDSLATASKRNTGKAISKQKVDEYEKIPTLPAASTSKTGLPKGSQKDLESAKETNGNAKAGSLNSSQQDLKSAKEMKGQAKAGSLKSSQQDLKSAKEMSGQDQSEPKDEEKKEADGQKMAMCMPNMKLFPCFRGEYPTRHRPGTYQWLQRTGPKGSQLMTLCDCEDDPTISADANIITSCEVTEAHFLSIECDDENKLGPTVPPCTESNSKKMWPPNSQNDPASSSYAMYTFPKTTTCPVQQNMGACGGFNATQPQMASCSAMQQQLLQRQQMQQQQQSQAQHHKHSQCLPCCPNQQQSTQSQTVCFNMQPEPRIPSYSSCNTNINGNGLTEMLAQQLQQQMQQAKAQIAQVQMQLNSACGATRVRKLQVISHSTIPNDTQDVGEKKTTFGGDEDEDAEQDDEPDDGNDLDDNEYTDVDSCPCIADQFRQQQAQQQQQQQQCQPQQQQSNFIHGAPSATPFIFPFPFPPSVSQPLQFGCYPMPNTTTFGAQERSRAFIPQQQQQSASLPSAYLCQQQQQQQQPQQSQLPLQQSANAASPQPSCHQSQLQQNSQQSMYHGNYFCPSCYRQRYAQMRFMMPRCWPH